MKPKIIGFIAFAVFTIFLISYIQIDLYIEYPLFTIFFTILALYTLLNVAIQLFFDE